MADLNKSILLRILGENAAKATFDEVAAEAEALKKSAEGEIDIKVNASEAKREIREVIAMVKSMPRQGTLFGSGDTPGSGYTNKPGEGGGTGEGNPAFRAGQMQLDEIKRELRQVIEMNDSIRGQGLLFGTGDPRSYTNKPGFGGGDPSRNPAFIPGQMMLDEVKRELNQVIEMSKSERGQGLLFGSAPRDAPPSYTDKPGLGGGTLSDSAAFLRPGQMQFDEIGASADRTGFKLGALKDRVESLLSSFDKAAGSGLTKFGDALKKTDESLGVGGGFGKFLTIIPEALGGIISGLGSMVTASTTAGSSFLALATAGVSLLAVAPIIAFIVVGLISLIGSLAMALIGVVALGAAFLAALLPIIAVLGAVVYQTMQTFQNQQKMQQTTAALTAAIDAQKAAAVALATAQATATRDRLAALQAEKDAVLALVDAKNRLTDSKLSVQSSGLALDQARLNLERFRANLAGLGLSPGQLEKKAAGVDVGGNLGQQQTGSSALSQEQMLIRYKDLVLAVKLAEQGRKEAIDGVATATNNLNKQETVSSNFATKGLAAYQPYAASLAAVASAQERLATSGDRVAAAQKAFNLAANNTSPAGLRLLGILQRFAGELGKIFTPAMNEVIKGMAGAIKIFGDHLKPLEPSLTLLGKAIGKAFEDFAKWMTNPQNMRAIEDLIKASARLVGPLMSIFGSLLSILLQIVLAAMPKLNDFIKNTLEPTFRDLAKHPEKIRHFIQDAIDKTNTWFTALGTIVGVFTTIYNTIKPILDVVGALEKAASWIGKELYGSAGPSTADIANHQDALHTDYTHLMADLNRPTVPKGFKGSLAAYRAYVLDQFHAIGLSPGSDPGPGQHFVSGGSRVGGVPVGARHALGGVATSASLGIFGEAGSEALVPLAGAGADMVGKAIGRYVGSYLTTSRAAMGSAHSGGGGMTQHVHVHLQEGNMIADDQHFLAVLQHSLESVGAGTRGL